MNKDSNIHMTPDYSISTTDRETSDIAFEQYQRFMENTISQMSSQINELEQKLNVFTNLLEISQYINQYIIPTY